MSDKNRFYYALDVLIAISAVLSLATGIVWLFTGSGGYQGGRNPQAVILGLERGTWSDLHTWFSLVMIAGALLHLALHWKWILSLTRRLREGKAKKARLNYYLDIVLGVCFILVALSGLVFLFAGQGGYQGGRNPDFQAVILGLNRGTWSDLHTWVSLVLVAAVLIHQAFHWSWIRNTTRRLFQPSGSLSGTRPAPRSVLVHTDDR